MSFVIFVLFAIGHGTFMWYEFRRRSIYSIIQVISWSSFKCFAGFPIFWSNCKTTSEAAKRCARSSLLNPFQMSTFITRICRVLLVIRVSFFCISTDATPTTKTYLHFSFCLWSVSCLLFPKHLSPFTWIVLARRSSSVSGTCPKQWTNRVYINWIDRCIFQRFGWSCPHWARLPLFLSPNTTWMWLRSLYSLVVRCVHRRQARFRWICSQRISGQWPRAASLCSDDWAGSSAAIWSRRCLNIVAQAYSTFTLCFLSCLLAFSSRSSPTKNKTSSLMRPSKWLSNDNKISK